jgi:hypothetical protein
MDANENIKRALNPKNFPGMSTKMMAIVGYMLGEKFVTPPVVKLIALPDGSLMAKVQGDSKCNDNMGLFADFKRDWNNMIHIFNLGLSDGEVKYLEQLPDVTIKVYNKVVR